MPPVAPVRRTLSFPSEVFTRIIYNETREAAMIETEFLREAAGELRRYREMAEKALAQVSDEDFFRQVDPESNSIAVIVKHCAGNMRSRWTDFLTTDGDKPDRDRDGEFVMEEPDERAALVARWNEAWSLTFAGLEALTAADMDKQVRMRGESQSMVRAIMRFVVHLTYHVGQIAFIAKHFSGARWQTLTTPRNRARLSTKRQGAPDKH
jgi:uncharacterized damage-inducible protein DinB